MFRGLLKRIVLLRHSTLQSSKLDYGSDPNGHAKRDQKIPKKIVGALLLSAKLRNVTSRLIALNGLRMNRLKMPMNYPNQKN